ncbi:MAG: hypothetical protein FD122_1921 [Stygiobacter sp.]|nr:MAG: hypothetical protein FD122_1921 [Stygiobacter sp.]KAF0211088.1 MAG: hypothetical protein FD178_3515 [Ignavibacteria bacterium]
MRREFRPGNIGALMDEYERASFDLRKLILSFSENEFERILDDKTDDEDCRSVQTIMHHVISAGYRYLNQINIFLKQEQITPNFEASNPASTIEEFDKMLLLTSEAVKNNLAMSYEEVLSTRMETRWGLYDIEMMFEHAIVHILRHRRQIEKLTQQK